MGGSNNLQPRREIGKLALMLSGITCIVGSGWLFGAYYASQLAGPASIFAWIIGGVAVLLIGLTVAELGTMIPKSGGMIHYLRESHGPLTGFIGGWANWVAIVVVIPAEAAASTQYVASWNYAWAHALFNPVTGTLTGTGLMFSFGLLVFYFLLNYWSLQLFIKSMKLITYYKIIVPLLTVVLLVTAAFHPHNFDLVNHAFAPYGWSKVLTAISTCGIIFAFNGFQTPVNLAGECKNPNKTIPFAVIGSIVICIGIYVLLQTAFIGALAPSALVHGWHNVFFSSPYAQMALILNLNFLAMLLYIDAFISPSGTGMTYLCTTSRMLYGMNQNKQMPDFVGKLHPKYRIPRGAIWVNFIVAVIFLFIFRGWGKLAGVLSVAAVISYLAGPIAMATLRKFEPKRYRPFKLPFGNLIAPLAFIVCSLVLYWASWPLDGEVIFVILGGLVIYAYYQHKEGWSTFPKQLKSSIWFIVYMVTIATISLFGSKDFGGLNYINVLWSQVLVGVVACIFFVWAKNSYYQKEPVHIQN
jgi:amino acid transporter